jgi:hypothetical protein
MNHNYHLTKLVVIMRKGSMECKSNQAWSECTCPVKLKKRLSFITLQIQSESTRKSEEKKKTSFQQDRSFKIISFGFEHLLGQSNLLASTQSHLLPFWLKQGLIWELVHTQSSCVQVHILVPHKGSIPEKMKTTKLVVTGKYTITEEGTLFFPNGEQQENQ